MDLSNVRLNLLPKKLTFLPITASREKHAVTHSQEHMQKKPEHTRLISLLSALGEHSRLSLRAGHRRPRGQKLPWKRFVADCPDGQQRGGIVPYFVLESRPTRHCPLDGSHYNGEILGTISIATQRRNSSYKNATDCFQGG